MNIGVIDSGINKNWIAYDAEIIKEKNFVELYEEKEYNKRNVIHYFKKQRLKKNIKSFFSKRKDAQEIIEYCIDNEWIWEDIDDFVIQKYKKNFYHGNNNFNMRITEIVQDINDIYELPEFKTVGALLQYLTLCSPSNTIYSSNKTSNKFG